MFCCTAGHWGACTFARDSTNATAVDSCYYCVGTRHSRQTVAAAVGFGWKTQPAKTASGNTTARRAELRSVASKAPAFAAVAEEMPAGGRMDWVRYVIDTAAAVER